MTVVIHRLSGWLDDRQAFRYIYISISKIQVFHSEINILSCQLRG